MPASGSTSPPRVVCFDLGGVVIRIVRSWAEGCAAAGLEGISSNHTDKDFFAAVGSVIDAHQTGALDGHGFARGVSEHLGPPWRPEHALAVHRAWMIGEYAGVEDLIAQLHAASIETAALSNTNHVHWEQLEAYSAFRAIRHRFASHELGLAKPDPAIYRAFEDRAGFTGRDVLFFDDLPENIAAARATGWDAVQIDPMRETAPQIRTALHERGIAVE